MSSRSGTSNSQISFSAWLCLGISKPSPSSILLRLLYSLGRVALDKTQVGAELGLHHLRNPRVNAPSGQLHATLEHCHRAPPQLILHRGQRLVVSGHSQSLQLTGLGKSHWSANSNQGSTTGERCMQPTWRVHLEYPAWMIEEAVPLDRTRHLLQGHAPNTQSQSSST